MRLIDADELKKVFAQHEDRKGDLKADWEVLIDNAPTVKTFTLLDVEENYKKGLEKGLSEWETERPQGKWIYDGTLFYKCSVCNNLDCFNDNFCPNCGADMRGDKE